MSISTSGQLSDFDFLFFDCFFGGIFLCVVVLTYTIKCERDIRKYKLTQLVWVYGQ